MYLYRLSVFHFLRTRTYLRVDDLPQAQHAVQDCVELAKLEGVRHQLQSISHCLTRLSLLFYG